MMTNQQRGGESSRKSSSSLLMAAGSAIVALTTTYVVWKKYSSSSSTSSSSDRSASFDDENNVVKKTDTTTIATSSPPIVTDETDGVDKQQQQQHPVVKEIRAISTDSNMNNDDDDNQYDRILRPGCITIVHGSVTGTTARCAQQLYDRILMEQQKQTKQMPATKATAKPIVQMGKIDEFDWWDELLNYDGDDDDSSKLSSSLVSPPLLIVLLPTYTAGSWTPTSVALQTALQDLANDWRIEKFPLAKTKLRVAIFGMGSSAYNNHATTAAAAAAAVTTASDTNGTTTNSTTDSTRNKSKKSKNVNNMGLPAREAIRQFQKLGAKCLVRLQVGDDAVDDHAETTFQAWQSMLVERLHKFHYFDIDNSGNNNNNNNGQQQQGLINDTIISTTTTKPTTSAASSSCACQEQDGGTTVSSSCCQSSNHDHDDTAAGDNTACCNNGGNSNDDGDKIYDIDEEDEELEYSESDDEDEQQPGGEPELADMEDMGTIMARTSSEKKNATKTAPRAMVTPSQAHALKKEGYRLIGTHSAVKLCRWTKHQLRGRGGCYKHTFYGITSYQCMEATPSLACANKCVFCWRHHKNPVGKEWKWKTDDPGYIVDQAVQEHVRMIKETKGIPGVQMDRWREAHRVKHCALSLVGEPIMYPRINELLGGLHERGISSFLVTNGQHPPAISTLRPVTQLYVSVDAPTEESLIAIDRPLFNDAWDRLKESLVALKEKGQRTVARLTVVKGWNSDEVAGYAKLVALGRVSLVEVKGVTFCGKSDASNLNMSNTPWHHEVVALTRTLRDEINNIRNEWQQPTSGENGPVEPPPEYGLACEHKHSCSVLLARVDQFSSIDPVTEERKWRTWIDYDRFQELAARHAEDPSFTFQVEDYTAETPSWALFGSDEEGFDPTDTRHRKKTKHPKYTRFDEGGIPTHDHNNVAIDAAERARLVQLMKDRVDEIGTGSTVTEFRDGAKEIADASLMFRGMVVAK